MRGRLRTPIPLAFLSARRGASLFKSKKEATPNSRRPQQVCTLQTERQLSARIGGTLLCLFLHHCCRLRRKLKYRCLLAFTEFCQANHLPVWKFQCVMVHPRLVFVDVSEDCRRVSECYRLPAEQAGFCNCYLARKRKLGTGKNANCHSRIFRRHEAPRAGAEVA